ncbi:hypothetical protein DFH27DRAFT_606187 [Peziza echinospora]|nr:hypothetical protein DFH27DRAFT_606187 [Peziza echinospora]
MTRRTRMMSYIRRRQGGARVQLSWRKEGEGGFGFCGASKFSERWVGGCEVVVVVVVVVGDGIVGAIGLRARWLGDRGSGGDGGGGGVPSGFLRYNRFRGPHRNARRISAPGGRKNCHPPTQHRPRATTPAASKREMEMGLTSPHYKVPSKIPSGPFESPPFAPSHGSSGSDRDDACNWGKVDYYNAVYCYRMQLSNLIELREARDCAICKGVEETQWLRFTKPLGLSQDSQLHTSRSWEKPQMTTTSQAQTMLWEERQFWETNEHPRSRELKRRLEALIIEYKNQPPNNPDSMEELTTTAAEAPETGCEDEEFEGAEANGDSLEPDFTMKLWGEWVFTWTSPWRTYKWEKQKWAAACEEVKAVEEAVNPYGEDYGNGKSKLWNSVQRRLRLQH